METSTWISIFLGFGLAASVGFRVFLPLFCLSLAAHLGLWELNDNWQWLGGTAAMITFGAATMVELLAYFVPWLDNLLDSLSLPLAAVAGTAVMVATTAQLDPVITWSLAIIAGGGTATAIKGATASGRLVSTTATAGFGNPLLAFLETAVSLIMSVLAVLAPVIAALLALLLLWLVVRLYRRIKRKSVRE